MGCSPEAPAGTVPPSSPSYPRAPSTAVASTAPRLARMEAMTTTALPRRAGAGVMVLGLAAGRRWCDGWGDRGSLLPRVLG